MAQPRYFKKGSKYLATVGGRSGFLELEDGTVLHKHDLKGFKEVSESEYQKGKDGGDKAVGTDSNASKRGPAKGSPGAGVRSDSTDNDGSGQDAKGKAKPANASGAKGD